jgi:hypothetical protein
LFLISDHKTHLVQAPKFFTLGVRFATYHPDKVVDCRASRTIRRQLR